MWLCCSVVGLGCCLCCCYLHCCECHGCRVTVLATDGVVCSGVQWYQVREAWLGVEVCDGASRLVRICEVCLTLPSWKSKDYRPPFDAYNVLSELYATLCVGRKLLVFLYLLSVDGSFQCFESVILFLCKCHPTSLHPEIKYLTSRIQTRACHDFGSTGKATTGTRKRKHLSDCLSSTSCE